MVINYIYIYILTIDDLMASRPCDKNLLDICGMLSITQLVIFYFN
jgi:hypothetical protein